MTGQNLKYALTESWLALATFFILDKSASRRREALNKLYSDGCLAASECSWTIIHWSSPSPLSVGNFINESV